VDHLVKEIIEIQLHPNNFNRDSGFMLSWTWQPLLQQVWNTSNGIWVQTQHSLDSTTYWVASSYKLCVGRGIQAGQIECKSYLKIIRMETKSVSEASMCLNCLVGLSAKKDCIEFLFYVMALLLEFCTSLACWFFKMIHPLLCLR
jgi:hypothetical protein